MMVEPSLKIDLLEEWEGGEVRVVLQQQAGYRTGILIEYDEDIIVLENEWGIVMINWNSIAEVMIKKEEMAGTAGEESGKIWPES
jgi:hypothetical protein